MMANFDRGLTHTHTLSRRTSLFSFFVSFLFLYIYFFSTIDDVRDTDVF